jgi:hypothetical protein
MKVAQRKGVLLASLHLLLMIMAGCVSVPREHLSRSIGTQELSDHVHFLAQPALKGRKPRTWESATARRYLKSRFEAYGLVPWADRKGYEQSFGFGTNVIGILPGSDPSLADEIVVVTAHYDHVGKTKKGVLLGACDNASGVAALLEIAEQLSMRPDRPRRSVCFASFDCEEQFTLGSFVFTCQEDFDPSKIAAVVNIDLLGRDFLDVVPDSLFVVGTERCPQMRAKILQAGAENGLKVLPVGTDIVGPRGDHVAFETMEIPVLFFTSGLNKDYHKPTDTADKIAYPKMNRSTALIAKTIESLANADQIERLTKQTHGDKNELLTLIHVLEAVRSDPNKAGLVARKQEEVPKLLAEAQSLLSDTGYTRKSRQRFALKTIETLLPGLTAAGHATDRDANGLLIMNELYSSHRKVLTEGYREVVRHILRNKPGLFGEVEFKRKVYDVGEDELSFVEMPDGQYQLDIILMEARFNYQIKAFLFRSGFFSFGFGSRFMDFLGSEDQVTDYCLLEWRKNLTDRSYSQAWTHILKTVTGKDHGTTYDDWMRWRLQKHDFAEEKQWLQSLVEGDNMKLAGVTIGSLLESDEMKLVEAAGSDCPNRDTPTVQELQAIIRDPNASPGALTSAVWRVDKDMGKEGLLTLVGVLDDERPSTARMEQPRFMDESYPFANHRLAVQSRKWWKKQPKVITIADDAQMRLKFLTKQNFDKDAKAWRKWIRAHVK